MRQHFAHESLLADELGLQVEIANGLRELRHQMINEFQFLVGERLTGNLAAECEHAEQLVVVEHRHGNFCAE